MRSDWLLPICTGEERLKDDAGDKVHPTQKPEALLYRVLLASTKPGDVVLDPFFGTGTTGAVAKRLGRHSSASSANRPMSRRASAIAMVIPRDAATLKVIEGKRAEPRIPFGSLVEAGLIAPGDGCTDARRRAATVRADGSLVAGAACRLDPPRRRGGAGRRGLQRLDLLARRARGRSTADDCPRSEIRRTIAAERAGGVSPSLSAATMKRTARTPSLHQIPNLVAVRSLRNIPTSVNSSGFPSDIARGVDVLLRIVEEQRG